WPDGKSAHVFQVKLPCRFENRCQVRSHYLARSKIISLHTVPAIFVELNTELLCQLVEMIELGIPDIIAHQNENAARFHPIGDRFHMLRLNEVRTRSLFLCVRVN